MGRPSRIKIVRLAATWIFFGADTKNCKKRRFLLKPLLLDIFVRENFSGIGPCESWHPEDSEIVVLFGRASFLTGVIAAQSRIMSAKVKASPKLGDVKKRHDHSWPIWTVLLCWNSALGPFNGVTKAFLTNISHKGWLPSAKLKPTFTFLGRDFAK